MASIQVLTRKTGKSYRIQFMRNSNRVFTVLPAKKAQSSTWFGSLHLTSWQMS